MKEVLVAIAHEKEGLEFKTVEVNYDFLRTTVDGYIEGIYDLEDEGIMMCGNEESKLEKREPNLVLYEGLDFACGTVIFTNETVDEEGESIYEDLTKAQVETIKVYYNANHIDGILKDMYANLLNTMY